MALVNQAAFSAIEKLDEILAILEGKHKLDPQETENLHRIPANLTTLLEAEFLDLSNKDPSANTVANRKKQAEESLAVELVLIEKIIFILDEMWQKNQMERSETIKEEQGREREENNEQIKKSLEILAKEKQKLEAMREREERKKIMLNLEAHNTLFLGWIDHLNEAIAKINVKLAVARQALLDAEKRNDAVLTNYLGYLDKKSNEAEKNGHYADQNFYEEMKKQLMQAGKQINNGTLHRDQLDLDALREEAVAKIVSAGTQHNMKTIKAKKKAGKALTDSEQEKFDEFDAMNKNKEKELRPYTEWYSDRVKKISQLGQVISSLQVEQTGTRNLLNDAKNQYNKNSTQLTASQSSAPPLQELGQGEKDSIRVLDKMINSAPKIDEANDDDLDALLAEQDSLDHFDAPDNEPPKQEKEPLAQAIENETPRQGLS